MKTKRADGKAHAALHLEPRHALMLTSCSRSRGTARAANVGPAQLPRALAHAPGISPGKACGQARADLRDAGRSSSGTDPQARGKGSVNMPLILCDLQDHAAQSPQMHKQKRRLHHRAH